jgi:hypothetical protein
MKNKIAAFLTFFCVMTISATAAFDAHAQSNTSEMSAVSALAVMSVVSSAGPDAGSVVMVPVMLSTAGAVLVIKAVEASARGTIYVMERASDGARVSLQVAGKGIAGTAAVVGASVVVSVISAGVVLSAAGEAIAFIPNALGRSLLHNQRLTQ